MTFSQEIKDKMVQFAKEQSQYYLDEAEMTYLEKLRWKPGKPGARSRRNWKSLRDARKQPWKRKTTCFST